MANGTISANETMFSRNHASQIFVANNHGLSPKYGWLFHVAFDINTEISRVKNDDLLRMGFVVKAASLPKFSVETKTLNAYNRVDIVQSKVKYDSVTIKFHDDNLDVVRNFWYDYYSYYYRDADWNPSIYQAATKYNERQNQSCGYTPRQYPASSPATQQYLSSIRIYSLHNKRFAEYTLINPTITQFQHGEHTQGGEGGTLENTMTISYQAVKYEYGDVSADTVTGFASLQYDSRPSPMGTTTSRDSKIHDLSEGASGLPGVLNNLKNLNGSAILGGVLSAAGTGLATGLLTGQFNGKIKALAGGASDLLSSAKSKIGSAFSNGHAIDGATGASIGQDGLPNDGDSTASTDQTEAINTLNTSLMADENELEQVQADLEASIQQSSQLSDQIEADKEQLLNPDLTSEDLSALQSIIDQNQNELDAVTNNIDELLSRSDELFTNIESTKAQIARLEEAQNPSGNDAEDGGPGPDSTTTTYYENDGTMTTTTSNPDGSQTTVDGHGNISTVPQQNPIDNPNASSKQQEIAPAYSGPRVVYAPDGSSSPVDELGNVTKSLINGSYNH